MNETPVKKPYKSKTIWVNLIMGVIAFFPSVSALLTPEQILLAVSAVNIILRLISKDKIGMD